MPVYFYYKKRKKSHRRDPTFIDIDKSMRYYTNYGTL